MYLFTMPMNKAHKTALLAAAAAALALATSAAAAVSETNLSLVGYSTPKAVMGKIIQAWQQTPDGKDASFSQSYGASTDQARAVANGLKADILFLSTGDDMNLLVDAGLVDSNWSHQSYGGIGADTVVVFAVRNGNPKHIKGWADLTKPGVQVITPNPFSSGSAKWNILAAYGAERRLGKTDKQATAYVQHLFKHVVSQDTSGRNATNTFLAGKGDVLITYESEALNARLNGQDIEYVIPRQSMLIELPIAVTKSSSSKDVANRFVRFVKGDAAQTLFAQYGFRPVNPKLAKQFADKFPSRPGIFKVDDKIIGGWRNADKVWFKPNTQDRASRRGADDWLATSTPRSRPGDRDVVQVRGPLQRPSRWVLRPRFSRRWSCFPSRRSSGRRGRTACTNSGRSRARRRRSRR
jgi:sulfate/thiosulfate transport system substrate-binding protein